MIYLDNNASTPIDPAVKEAMLPYLDEYHGNPSSSHVCGQQVHAAVVKAREQVANMLGATPSEIVFTASGTEANNHVIKGIACKLRERGRHIIVSSVEHPAVINPCKFLETQGYEVSYIPVDAQGCVDPQSVAQEVRPDTILISVMHANNEVGTIQPIREIAELAREGGILMHTDAAQTCGKLSTNVEALGVDFLSMAGHKFYAPQGIGALYIRNGVEIEPLLHGAGHESGRRAGTEAVPAIVGLGAAAQLAVEFVGSEDCDKMQLLRDRLYERLEREIGEDAVLLGHPTERLPNTLSVGFRGCLSGEIVSACPDLCVSTGAACHAGNKKRSAVLQAMDVSEEVAYGSIRFSLSRYTTQEEIDQAVVMIAHAVKSSTAA